MKPSRPSEPAAPPQEGGCSPLLVLAALGVVYGDIGTSPLYAVREAFLGEHSVPVTHLNVLGIMSLIFWCLILIISLKYLVFVLWADNRGEGGILALMALVVHRRGSVGHRAAVMSALGLFGAALLYGDSMITPAISVLSAVEGLGVVTPVFDPYIIPISLGILTGLFLIQHRGTAKVGAVFGPVITVWFVVLGVLGVLAIGKAPEVLLALNPVYAVEFFWANGWRGFTVIGTIFLVVTGGEALYADMGHFGKTPIRIGWFGLALPALLLNYLGQSAILLRSPEALPHLFFLLAPRWALVPLVCLATAATVIASQAVISGAFSLSRQAVQLGYSPRLTIRHTSTEEIGQIYVPAVNWVLYIGTVGLVLGFQKSGNLAHAYGVAVSSAMLITTLLMYRVTRDLWKWGRPASLAIACGLMIMDMSFFGANALKIASGGWFPLVIAGAVYALMKTWQQGRKYLAEKLRKDALSVEEFLATLHEEQAPRVSGTAIYLTGNPAGIPTTLLHNFNHNKILHEHVILLTVQTEEVPYVPFAERVQVEPLGRGIYRVALHYGFSQNPNVPAALWSIDGKELSFDEEKATYFLGKESLLFEPQVQSSLWTWQRRLFVFMSRNAQYATKFFKIPPERSVELGVQIEV